MEFKLIRKNFYTGITLKGNTVEYRMVDEDNIVFKSRDLSEQNIERQIQDPDTKQFITEAQPTKITLECSFPVTTAMLDLLESSQVIADAEMINRDNYHLISFAPYPLFNFLKLQSLIFDLCKKFDL
ncbi:hypothetical protein M2132_001783 [Dysgonomonas sp. PH5-45]|uniref:hypothetical protein n=1 Tax=unclassified Dysgonomonas TaxID=2630389 RepID=UPI002475E118|nr:MULTISPECIES: hypothetical protein [unclassified Dysgonomonas]MDH6355440.1 hypothetical protein [Dysgonomonas sp. PH5-45]MDH6388337.1 hypothetical protein [Dysgonomonas sp. PH5-37]